MMEGSTNNNNQSKEFFHQSTEYNLEEAREVLKKISEARSQKQNDAKLLPQLRNVEALIHHLKKYKLERCCFKRMNESKAFSQNHNTKDWGRVQKICGEKRIQKVLFYKVEWNTTEEERFTWEPAKIMEEDVPNKVEGWKKHNEEEARKRLEKRTDTKKRKADRVTEKKSTKTNNSRKAKRVK